MQTLHFYMISHWSTTMYHAQWLCYQRISQPPAFLQDPSFRSLRYFKIASVTVTMRFAAAVTPNSIHTVLAGKLLEDLLSWSFYGNCKHYFLHGSLVVSRETQRDYWEGDFMNYVCCLHGNHLPTKQMVPIAGVYKSITSLLYDFLDFLDFPENHQQEHSLGWWEKTNSLLEQIKQDHISKWWISTDFAKPGCWFLANPSVDLTRTAMRPKLEIPSEKRDRHVYNLVMLFGRVFISYLSYLWCFIHIPQNHGFTTTFSPEQCWELPSFVVF